MQLDFQLLARKYGFIPCFKFVELVCLPGFRGRSRTSARRRVSQRLRLLDADTAGYRSSIATSLLIHRPNLGPLGQPERFIANAVPKAIVPHRPVPFFQPFLATVCLASVKLLLSRCGPCGVLCGPSLFPTPVNATTDERNDDMKPTKFTNEAQLKALFDHAVRAIGFYEAQRKEALMALESLRRALNNRPPKPPTP
jgi:hypothetical protein